MISVIIPVYNVVGYLPACLDSVLAQSYRDFELLLVDDGSTDGSADLCDDYACRDARVTVIHQPNRGPSSARNTALEQAKGEYVAFVDSDDVIHSQYLEVLLKYSEQYDAEVVQAPYQIVDASRRAEFTTQRLSRPLLASPQIVTLSSQEALLGMLYQRGMADSSPCKLFRRALFDGLRFPVMFRVYEDLYLMAQLYPLIQKMVWVDLPMYFYFKQPTGTLCSLSTKRQDAFLVLQSLETQYQQEGKTELVRAARERRLSVAFNILRLLSRLPHTDANKAMAHHCWQHIKALRKESIHDPNARFKNRLVAIATYLINPRKKVRSAAKANS